MVNVCIVGVGLIGGSLGLALRRVRRSGRRVYHVVGWSRSRSSLILAQKKKAVDRAIFELSLAVAGADVVVLCTPVQIMGQLVRQMAPFLKKGAVLTDAGSIKEEVEKSIRKELRQRKDVSYVGAHPLAGSEKSGVQYAYSSLYQGATCVVTSRHRVIERLWADVGASVIYVKGRLHDQILGLTSHWPHILAFSLFSQFLVLQKKHPLSQKLTAGSFADAVRVAASEPVMWTGILSMNKASLKKIKTQFCRTLDRLMGCSPKELTAMLRAISEAKIKWQKS